MYYTKNFFLLPIDEGDEDDDDDQFQELEEAIYRFPLGDNGDDDLDLMIQYPDESNIGKSKFWFKISPLPVLFAFFPYNQVPFLVKGVRRDLNAHKNKFLVLM